MSFTETLFCVLLHKNLAVSLLYRGLQFALVKVYCSAFSLFAFAELFVPGTGFQCAADVNSSCTQSSIADK